MIVKLDNESMNLQAEHCQRLAYVLGLTQKMLKLADEGEWDQVATMEGQRRDDLIACFADARPSGEPELVAQALATLLHLNEDLMAKLRSARTEVMEQGEAFSRNRHAHQSYQDANAVL